MPEQRTESRVRVDERSAESRRAARQRRARLDGMNLELSVPEFQQPGYTLLWVDEIKTHGYFDNGAEFVDRDEAGHVGEGVSNGNADAGNRVSKVVGLDKQGNPRVNVLMKIKTDWYQEDQANLQRVNDEIENVIKTGASGISKDGFESTTLKEYSSTVTT